MLNKIQSIFFSRIIFTYIDEKIKLNIIKYNKSLQNILNVSILNYKILSGKIIIKESKGTKEIYKIYSSIFNNLIFEGEYLNGIGKEYYDNGNLLYEGQYLMERKKE